MIFRNKKTDEIYEMRNNSGEGLVIGVDEHGFMIHNYDFEDSLEAELGEPSCRFIGSYRSLAELNEEWEDYKPKPKRYRLLKDLPTFKAGNEFFIAPDGSLWLDQEIDGPNTSQVMAYNFRTLEKFPNILTDWFEEIDGEDTDVLSKEPQLVPKWNKSLIKDEKIRKAVRAWASIQEQPITGVAILGNKDHDGFLCYHLYGYIDKARIVNGKAVVNNNLTAIGFEFRSSESIEYEPHHDYTIEELCGEESEL